ncbi:MAG TPA: 8-oxo-dGTP diphosphatase [Elusimicrobiota bacterium]|nr:8-oxo-dGTP diphosphatase [Elusimicrobiota bacterium]
MNAFESGARKSIPAVLVYPRFGGRTLMLHRNARPGADFHHGKWNGLGGKMEPGESPLEAAARELREESGLRPARRAFRALGVLHFPDFKPARREDWMVFVFDVRVSAQDSRRRLSCPEGELHWIDDGGLLALNLWPGDRHFLPLVVAGNSFMGTIWYRGGRDVRRWIQRL